MAARRVAGRRYPLAKKQRSQPRHQRSIAAVCCILMLPVLYFLVSAVIWIETQLCGRDLGGVLLLLSNLVFEADTQQYNTQSQCHIFDKLQKQKHRLQESPSVKEIWVRNPFSRLPFAQTISSNANVSDTFRRNVPPELWTRVQLLCNGRPVAANAMFAYLPETAVF